MKVVRISQPLLHEGRIATMLMLISLLSIAVLSISSSSHAPIADAASTFTVQYMQKTVPLPHIMTPMMCQVLGMTLPIIDSADKQAQLVAFIAGNKALSSLGSSAAVTFLRMQITTGCSGTNYCKLNSIGTDDVNTTLAYLDSNGKLVTAVSGQYNNYVRSSSSPEVVVITKKGTWLGKKKDFTVPAVICESQSSGGGGGGNGGTTVPKDASSNRYASSGPILAATVYLAMILLFIIYA